jgi:hypothetical protein
MMRNGTCVTSGGYDLPPIGTAEISARENDQDDVYQALAYATRYGLDRVALIFAEPPPVPELQVGDITVRLLSVDLSATAFEREQAMTAIAQEWLFPQSLSPRGARVS